MTTKTARKSVPSVRNGRTAVAPELRERFVHMVEAGEDRVTEWKDEVQEGIRHKPLQSILIAAAVGTVVGLIVRLR